MKSRWPDPTPSNSQAAFVHSTFHFTDKLDLSAGARYTKDEKDYVYHRHNPDGTTSFITISPGVSGFEFVVGSGAKKTLTTRDAQHEYVFDGV